MTWHPFLSEGRVFRIRRGGSWIGIAVEPLGRSRLSHLPDNTHYHCGVRFVRRCL